MILVGNARGNYVDAAKHFMNAEDNEKVTVHEISGFMGNDLYSAFQESYAVSLGTKAKQHLYSLSLSPPKDADVSDEEFVDAINRAEQRLGLTGQPRTIVFHEKRGRDGELRRHAHAIWCRVDAENGRAIHLSHDHSKLFDLSHELFLEYEWELPKGYENKQERSPYNYTHAEHQQARRKGKYADDIKRIFCDAWERSDTAATFANALKEKGYILAKGSHAAFVAVDGNGEVYSVARCLPVNTKDIRARFGDMEHLPSVDEAELQARKLQPDLASEFSREASNQRQEQQSPSIDDSPIARRVRQNPEHVLPVITERESVFTHHAIAKQLNSYIHDPNEYRKAYQKVISSNDLVKLAPDAADNSKAQPRYSTREMVNLEQKLMDDVRQMANTNSFASSTKKVERAIYLADTELQADCGAELSKEQKNAIRHVTSYEQLSCVVGAAGTGKSTILNAAREAWEANGHRVFGAALAGKAAKGLEQSSGIQSRTLASFELSWQNGVNELQKDDVLVIDEAGMIGSRQMARFIAEAKDRGAKLVLVGDAEQLQPINAGAPFRAITEEIKPATLHEVHRQTDEWQKEASKDFALGRTKEALQTYVNHDRLDVTETRDDAIVALASDYLNDFWSGDERTSQIALAHRKIDVKAINKTIRKARKEAGELQDGQTYKTEHGRREFAAGDRLIFTRNDRDADVKNGMLGTVIETSKHNLIIELDDKTRGKSVYRTIDVRDYADIEHGYATTIHKAQGVTVDKSYILASSTMDRHLTYVAMTRHRQETMLYINQDEFPDYDTLAKNLRRKRQKQSTIELKAKLDRLDRLLEDYVQHDSAFQLQRDFDPEHQI